MTALEVAHAIGCRFLGGVTYSTLGWRSGKPPTEEEYANIVLALKPVARRAGEYGMTIGLEPCNRYETHLLNTAEQARWLIDRIGEPNLTIHLDTYHMNIEEKGLAAGFKAAGEATSYIHLSESHRGVPGTGSVDWDAAFASLAATGVRRRPRHRELRHAAGRDRRRAFGVATGGEGSLRGARSRRSVSAGPGEEAPSHILMALAGAILSARYPESAGFRVVIRRIGQAAPSG